MDKRNKISFIPQKPISRKVQRSGRPTSLLLVLSFAVFFFTFVLYGGMTFYSFNLKKVIDDKQGELKLSKEELDPGDTMGKAQKFQKKITDVKNVLDSHIAPSVVFGLLEDITLQSISFSTFEFTGSDDTTGQGVVVDEKSVRTLFSIKLKGRAPGYSSVAYQSEVIKEEIKENTRIEDFSISGISLDETGNVLFDLELGVAPSFLVYRDMVKQYQVLNKEIENIEKINSEDIPSLNSLDLEELDVIFNENE